MISAGPAHGLFSIALSGILSPILTGRLRGPLAAPFAVAVAPVLAVDALWGADTGLLVAGLQRVGRRRTRRRSSTHAADPR